MAKETVFIVGINDEIERMWKSMSFTVVKRIEDANIVQFIGGPDINPRLYNELPLVGTNSSDSLDARDELSWGRCDPQQLKVGICRGGQYLNCKSGGAMWQHVSGHTGHTGHKIKDCLDNRELQVTSTHHQMMIPGDDAEILAYAEGVARNHSTGKVSGRAVTRYDPEVVWYQRTRSLCFQPHPEYQRAEDTKAYYFDLIDYVL